jgi:TP901 family phage tail tape measure protein
MADREAQLRLRLTASNEAGPAFSELSSNAESFAKSLTEVNRAIQESFDSMAKSARDSSESVSQSVREDESVLEILESAIKSLSSVFSSATETMQRSFREMTSSLDESGRSIEEVLGSIETMMDRAAVGMESQTAVIEQGFQSLERAIAESSDAVVSSLRNVERASQEMAESTNRSTNEMKRGLNDAGLLIGLQMVGQSMEHVGSLGEHLFTDAIHQSADFEYNISRIHSVLMNREPLANMQAMADTALRLGQDSKFSANEIAEGMYDLARQGLSSTQILGDGVNGAIEIVNNLAQATDQSMSETAKVITDVMHEFNLSGAELAKVADIISGAMHTSSISMNDFYYAMRQVGPVASNMRQSVEDVATAIALLAQHGISGSAAGTALKNMLLGLEPHTKKAAELMRELGISAKNGAADSFYDLQGNLKPLPDIIDILNQKFGGLNDKQKEAALAATFTKYGLAGLNTVVMEGRDKFEELKKTLMDEKAADIAKEKMNNLEGDLLRVKASADTLSKSFGDTLHPVMRTIAQAAESLTKSFMGLSPGVKEAIMVVLGIGTALATVGGGIVTFVSTIGFLKIGLDGLGLSFTSLLTPVGLVSAAIVAVGLAAYELYKHWDAIKAKTKELYDKFIEFKNEAIEKVKDAFKDLEDKLTSFKDKFMRFKDEVVGEVKKKFDDLNDTIQKHKQGLQETAEVLGTIFGPALIKTGIEAAVAAAKIATEFTVAVVKAGVEAAVTGAKLAAEFIVNVVKSGVEAVIAAGKITANLVVAIVQMGMEAVVTGAKLTASVIAATIELGVQAVITAGKITGQAIVALASYAAEGWVAAASLAKTTAELVAQTAAWVAQKAAVVASTVAMGAMEAAQWALNAAMDANPIGAVILAITALGAAVYELVKHFQDLVDWVEKAWNWLTKWNSTPAEDKTINVKTNYETTGDPGVAAGLQVPAFAEGGVVDRPTLALVGEGGEREYIIPESKLKQGGMVGNLPLFSAGSGQYASSFTDVLSQGLLDGVKKVKDSSEQIAKAIASALDFQKRPTEGAAKDSDRWSPNFVQMFSDGLTDGTSRVADSSRKLAQTLADYLGFHSPTEQGPASDSDQWAPNFIDMLSKGLLDGVPKVRDAANQVAQAIKDAFTQLINDIQTSAQQLTDAVKSTTDTMQTAFNDAFDAISKKADETLDHIKQQIAAMQQAVQNVSFSRTGGGGGDSGPVGLSGDALSAYNDAIAAGGVSLADGGFQSGDQADAAGLGGAAPAFASGGYVTKPTLALVGEAGPEYIIPEAFLKNQNGYTLGLPNGFGAGAPITQNITININGAGKDGRQLGSDIVNVLRQQMNFAFR